MAGVSLTGDFWDLLGTWTGVEEQSASPWARAARTRAALTFKLDLAGTAVVQDYRQVRDDGGELTAHGVLLADEADPAVVLWWLFDSYGQAPAVARGAWSDRVLTLERPGGGGVAHHRFDLGADRLAYAVDVALGGAAPVPFLRGRYERVSGH